MAIPREDVARVVDAMGRVMRGMTRTWGRNWMATEELMVDLVVDELAKEEQDASQNGEISESNQREYPH